MTTQKRDSNSRKSDVELYAGLETRKKNFLSFNSVIFLTFNVPLILKVREVYCYAGKTQNKPFSWVFRGAPDFFVP